MNDRLAHLDGMRGLAILLVVGYHTFARRPELTPFGFDYVEIYPFKVGWLGVELFFLISGFLITMSIERYPNFFVFFGKRWLRLFPAMLVVTIIIFTTAALLPDRPKGTPALTDVIPGLFFIEPAWLHKIFGISARSLEGGFWTLYVEAKFYFFAAIFYYLFRQHNLYYYLFAAFIAAVALNIANQFINHSLIHILTSITYHGSFEYFGWFAAGTAAYYYHRTKQPTWLCAGLIAAFASCVYYINKEGLEVFFNICVIVILFFSACVSDYVKKALSNRIFLFFGFISYPLYLVHDNMLIGMMIKIHSLFPNTTMAEYLLPPMALVVLIAFVVAKYAEPYMRNTINSYIATKHIATKQKNRTP